MLYGLLNKPSECLDANIGWPGAVALSVIVIAIAAVLIFLIRET